MTLRDLKVGESAVITSVGGEGSLRQHFLDMGVIPGAEVTVTKFAPMGDPMELQIHGYELTLRLLDASEIKIEKIVERKNKHERIQEIIQTEHPGLGEDGKYHSKTHENPLPKGTTLTFALVGNQNCGKTTLFNQLTGSNQHVGNFPGVTVDKKTGMIKGRENTLVTDLPGIYSMSQYSSEEIVSRNFVLNEQPKAIINIVDATNIERNLYLTMQLLEMNIPMVIALNMMDELIANHGEIDINGMESLLGVPVVPISAIKNQGIQELVNHAVHLAQYQEKPVPQDYCLKSDHDGSVHKAIHTVEAIIENHAEQKSLPVRFCATKIIEGDKLILEKLSLDSNEKEMIEHVVLQMENESKMDRSAAMADMRFDFIERVCEKTVKKPVESIGHRRSEKIDRILTGKWTAIPCFILIMALVFYLTFNVIGSFFQDLIQSGLDVLSGAVEKLMVSSGVNIAIQKLVTDGIFGGVGGVLSFLPIIVTLFFFLSILEDSGYIARVAFFMDKLLRKIGLSGKSIVSLLIGFGCTVPAVMSTRTLPSRRDRRMTILLTPFMSRTAKLPLYAFFVDAFLPKHGALVLPGLYFLGILVGIIVALVYKSTIFKGTAVPFVMELPNYRLPGIKNVAQLLWEKAKDFVTRAFTVIFVATIVVWFFQSFDFKLNYVEDSSKSIMAMIAGFVSPLFKPIGLDDWRIITSLISGIMAKETVVSSMQVLFSSSIVESVSAVTAASMLVFSLLYTPCVAAIASIKRELGTKWALCVALWQCVLAWIFALLTRLIFNLF